MTNPDDDSNLLTDADRALAGEQTTQSPEAFLPIDATPVASVDGLGKRLRQVLRRDHLIQLAVVYATVVVLVAIIGPFFLTDASRKADFTARMVPPFHLKHGWEMFLGTDSLGRSELAQLVVATRTTLEISVLAVVTVAIVGTLIGTVVGYIGGWAEAVAMRIADVLLAFPTLLLALVVLYTLPTGLLSLIFVLAVTRLAVYVRVARGEARLVRTRLFVRASKAIGAGTPHIVFRQVLPVIAPTIGVLATIEFALMILAESSLSFLGIGVQSPNITWGSMIAQGSNYLANAWWIAVLPGIAIAFTTISVNLIADWFRKAGESH